MKGSRHAEPPGRIHMTNEHPHARGGKFLEGQTALVTGASRGIGRAVARRLAAAGACTYLNYLKNEASAQETLSMITGEGGSGMLLRFDVADFGAAQEAVQQIIRERGTLDILVNNAGITLDGIFVRMGPDDWNTVIDTNLKGALNCTRAALRYMMKQRRGRIVNISSIVAETGNPGQAVYAATKAGLLGLTKSLAREFASRNILINAVAPGFIETDMTAAIPEAPRADVKKMIPLERLGTPDDVAGAVAFLVSKDADYITGQVIHVNGGLYM